METWLSRFGQEHLLLFWDALDDRQRQSLAAELRGIDLELVKDLYEHQDGHAMAREVARRAISPPSFRLSGGGKGVTAEEAYARGVEGLRFGQIGVILVAGGQGTRLGFNHPKGMFAIGPLSGKSLFQIHVEKVVAASRRYGARIPLYLMTSPATHDETVEFFARHDRFGLPEEDLSVFCQATMPALDMATGKILLAEPGHVALAPDGHGGMVGAIHRSGVLRRAKERGMRHLFHLQVDNPLVDVCGPEFLGYHLLSASETSTQVIRKQEPREQVGNVVQVEGRLRVIEYSHLPDEVANRRNPDGSLEIWAGSIGVHVFDLDFLERVGQSLDLLPFHVARKKVPYVDLESGQRVEPQTPNAIKFERFIFDLLPSAENAIVVEVDPARHFAPLKNPSGEKSDTPETVRAQMIALQTEWLRQAGAEVAEGVPVEISPLFALDVEELKGKIEPGTRVTEPTCYS